MNLDDDNIAYSCHFLAKLHRNPFLGELSGAENRNAKALGMTDRQTPKGQQQNSQNLLNLVDEIFRFVNLDRTPLKPQKSPVRHTRHRNSKFNSSSE
jgi:hypothetical protein